MLDNKTTTLFTDYRRTLLEFRAHQLVTMSAQMVICLGKLEKVMLDHLLQAPEAAGAEQLTLTSTHQCATLVPNERSAARLWRNPPNLRPRMSRATSASSRILCGDSSPCRTPKSGRRRGSGRPLPALPTPRLRKPFPPPCQLPPQRLTASPRSAIKLGGICPHRLADCLLLRDC